MVSYTARVITKILVNRKAKDSGSHHISNKLIRLTLLAELPKHLLTRRALLGCAHTIVVGSYHALPRNVKRLRQNQAAVSDARLLVGVLTGILIDAFILELLNDTKRLAERAGNRETSLRVTIGQLMQRLDTLAVLVLALGTDVQNASVLVEDDHRVVRAGVSVTVSLGEGARDTVNHDGASVGILEKVGHFIFYSVGCS